MEGEAMPSDGPGGLSSRLDSLDEGDSVAARVCIVAEPGLTGTGDAIIHLETDDGGASN